MILVDASILTFPFVVGALASPFPLTQEPPRDGSSPAINASIRDHNGHDVTSSFQVMVYQEPEKAAAVANLTDRRRQPAVLSRPIMDCPMPNSVFVDSVCTYENGKEFGMQSWELSCYVLMGIPDSSSGRYHNVYPVLSTRSGHCNDDEICVDGLGRGGGSRHGQHSVATCVSKQYFVRMIENSGRPASHRSPLVGLDKKQVRMMASGTNGNTPMEVDSFDITALDGTGNPLQDSKCRDCTGLKTGTLGLKTDGLRAQATLLTSGAVAGILWLAIMSG